MTEENNDINDMIADGVADNPFQASHIANGLRLWECSTLADKRARWRLYRRWRQVGKDPKLAYQLTLLGEEAPV